MGTVTVVNHLTLDGVIQAPAHPDEDRRGGFEHGGWASEYFDDVQGEYMGAESVAALLMVATIAGILMAGFLNNGGGAWDNAKKYIETGAYGGKRSEAHKAAVVGDTVGDPFKDTAGPSLHVLIKLLSTITLVLAPLFI